MITADFTYVTKTVGTKFSGRIECRDFDEAMEASVKIADWCSACGFRLLKCDINEVLSIEEEPDEV